MKNKPVLQMKIIHRLPEKRQQKGEKERFENFSADFLVQLCNYSYF